MARISPKMKLDRLLTTVMGSPAANAENERSAHNGGAVDAEALSDLAGHRELVGMLFGVFLKDVHIRFLRYFEDWFSSKSSSDSNT